MRAWVWLFAVLAMFTAAPVAANDLTGTWVAGGTNGAYLIQLVENNSGGLTGRYEEVILQPSGKITDSSLAIEGAAGQGTVVITLRRSNPLAGDLSLSGTLDGRALSLSSGALKLRLLPSDQASFQALVDRLDSESSEIKGQKMVADTAVRASRLTEMIGAFNSHADAQLPKFQPFAEALRGITAQMQRALDKEALITGDARATGQRSTVVVWINQAAIQAVSLHNSALATFADFDSSAKGIVAELAALRLLCANSSLSECTLMTDSAKTFAQKEQAVRQAFANLDVVWASESAKQDGIVRQAEVSE